MLPSKSLYLKLSLIIIKISAIQAWDLSFLNISSNYYVSSIAIFGNRGYLALPRSSCHNNQTDLTIIEISWTSWFSDQQKININKPFLLMDYQEWDNCEHIQDAISLDFEHLKARLWILDRGNSKCPAKIVIYQIFQKTVIGYDLPGVPQDKLNSLVLDPIGYNSKAYIGFSDGVEDLIIFALSQNTWWTVNLNVSTNYLAVSRKDSMLYITGENERGIYSLNINNLQVNSEIELTYKGEKLGDSAGLVTDLKDGLIYYLVRDYAIVRWDMRFPSEAENYNILAQSYEILPSVAQLYTGPYNGIYALVNGKSINDCTETSNPEVDKRLVKILKYNMFT